MAVSQACRRLASIVSVTPDRTYGDCVSLTCPGPKPSWPRAYTGDSQHKSKPADYGFHPPANPRPNKSLYDGSRIIKLAEATALFREGIRRGMISTYCVDGLAKYVWAVDAYGHVYEAKLSKNSLNYQGYELGCNERAMKTIVAREWNLR